MKKILTTIVFILICYFGYGQYPIIQNLGGPTTLVQNPNYGGFRGGLIPFTFSDTTAANLTNLKYYAGALIYTSSPRAVFWRDLVAQQWVQVLPSGGSTGTLAWVMGGNNPVVSDGSGNAILGAQTNNGVALMTNNTQRLILPAAGLTFNQLVTDTTLNKVLTYNTSTKNLGYGYWYGGGSSSTPTWQQTLTSGSTLTGDNTVTMGSTNLTFRNATTVASKKFSIINSNATDSAYFYVKGGSFVPPLREVYLGVNQTSNNTLGFISVSNSASSANVSARVVSTNGSSSLAVDSTKLQLIRSEGSNVSYLTIYQDTIRIKAYNGNLRLDSLTNIAARYVLHYNPTTGLVSYADTTASSSGSSSLTNLLNINQVPHSGIVVSQDSVIIFGDSYVVGTGATSAAYGWASVLSKYMNAVLDNRGVDGTTLEKRTPVDWVGGAATNMIDLLPTVPVKTAKKKLLIIALALNDWGYNGGQYNPVNYKTDYDSVMNYITNTKGWPAKNVLIISPYWIGAAGRTQYAGLSGNAAPTYAQALVFIDSTKAVADQWGTLYFDIYHDQYNNDTTLFNGGNPIHPDDSGYLYIARDIYTYLAPNIQLWKQNTTNEVMPYFATNTPASTTTPASINLGASYASSAGLPGSTKLKLYYDGTTNNTVGFGVSTAGLESNVFSGGTFDYYVGAYKIASFGVGNANIRTAVQFSGYGAGAATFDALGNITSVSDMRLKNLQGYYHGGLTELMNITPIIYKWKPDSGMETKHDYIGFSAQNIKYALGEGSYGVNSKGYLSIQDRAIMATMVNAIQELQKEVNDLKQQIKNK